MTKRTRLTKILKNVWLSVAVVIILAAAVSSIFRSLTPWATQYKGEIEHRLSLLLGEEVSIESMETGWHWFEPVLKLNNLTIHEHNNHQIKLEKLLIGINLFKSLRYWTIQPGIFYLDGLHLNVRQKDSKWSIDGLTQEAASQGSNIEVQVEPVVQWFSLQERLIIKNVSLNFYLQNGSVLPFSGLNISLANHGGHYKIKGDARLSQTNRSRFELLGDLHFDLMHLDKTTGTIFFTAKRLAPAQWQSLLPGLALNLEGGRGDLTLWLDFRNGHITSAQSQVKFKRLAFSLPAKNKSELIQTFNANMQWKPEGEGWEFKADQIQLRVAGVNWPDNKLSLHYNPKDEAYRIYVHSILLHSLLSKTIHWPEALKPIIKMKPHGLLRESQCLIMGNKIVYFLTRFEDLGWNAYEKIPKVEHVSGAISARQDSGKLELDSEQSVIYLKGYPTQILSFFNASVNWQVLSDGLKVSIEELLVSQPDLTFSIKGQVDGISQKSLNSMQVQMDFAGKNMQQWLPYLPKPWLKPKLLSWLQHNIKKVPQATGQISISGLAKDFPYDDGSGEFIIKAQSTGGTLGINSEWMLIKNIDVSVLLNRRKLEFWLAHGELNGASIKNAHIYIDNIGKDKEELVIEGNDKVNIQKILGFILKSPLKKRLSILNNIQIKGEAIAELLLRIPLYPERQGVVLDGKISFAKNDFKYLKNLASIDINKLNGDLLFNQKGLVKSQLTGSALGYPVSLTIETLNKPRVSTLVDIVGECSIESLKNKFKWPLLSLMRGSFAVRGQISVSDQKNNAEEVTLSSSLQGLTINLPKPLGKAAGTKAPLKLSVDLSNDNAIRVKGYYNQHISTDLECRMVDHTYQCNKGQIHLGAGQAKIKNKPGFEISGSLDGFSWDDWSRVWKKLDPQGSSISVPIERLRLNLSKFEWLARTFHKVRIDADKKSENEWSIKLNQEQVKADLVYRLNDKGISGHFYRLHLPKVSKHPEQEAKRQLNPSEFPPLNIRIDDLILDDMQVGSMTLKTRPEPHQWVIENCRIESPVYAFEVEGAWSDVGGQHTDLKVEGQLTHLAETLKRWQITPTVNARKGELAFSGGWRGQIDEFSWARLKGTLKISLKNGVITHLSSETEEKLGIGKLLSILSLQTIPRRLSLDFSDLSENGFSFDQFKATFAIAHGTMTTNDAYLDGPVAAAQMNGSLDLVHRLYDLDLTISPHIAASLPIVATIAGGPIAGIATWVASKLITQGIQKISGYRYKVSGPWSEPVVQQISFIKHKPRHRK